jgi:hypothetical protein
MMGVPERWGPTRSGRATLKSLDDQDAQSLQPGDVVLTMSLRGLTPLYVARCRIAVGGEHESRIEVPVVDARFLDGVCLTYAPCDLLRVSVKGMVGT